MTPERVTEIIENHKADPLNPDLPYDAAAIAAEIPDQAIEAAVNAAFQNWQTVVWDQVSDVRTNAGNTYSAEVYKQKLLDKGWWDGVSQLVFQLNPAGNVAHVQCFNPDTGNKFDTVGEAGSWGLYFINEVIASKIENAKAKAVISKYRGGA